ncbi:Eukaryotic aspartyl protease family protein [Hibiscus syriacus]|uniref:Eukaryotic aspartyl protease family protein n=1 Tax=Hibiscus syriacus TaxID=106335 RepID=A0A6A3C7A3_HIBSY|nr:Eukaryotic aspartyl protease family protein [Hibiscus syriacus]
MVFSLSIVLLKFIVNNKTGMNPEIIFDNAVVAADPVNLEFLPVLFNDLNNEGSLLSTKIDMEFSDVNDLKEKSFVPNESFDFIFTKRFQSTHEFIDRILKVGGIVSVQELGEWSSHSFNNPSDYKIVYYKKFQSINVFVMKKLKNVRTTLATTKRRLLGYNTSEAKKAALKKLEDVLLEPPRAFSGTSKTYRKRTKYLPDLLGDTLESYPRRVFIDVGSLEEDVGSSTNWFSKHYPTRNLEFEMYKIETLTKESWKKKAVPETMGMSDWLRKNVKEEEYVVMKAEAEVVEDMVKSKAIRLVDELFLECNPKGVGGRKNMRKRAYWECLALYGKLRDEVVAVHQWWG